MKLKDIKPNPNNPRVLRDDKFQKLKQSITEFPKMLSLRPMVIDENNVVLGGNMRLRALQELGFNDIDEAWVKRSSDLTEEEKKRFIIADNVAFGEWDWDTLANDWDVVDLEAWGLDIPQFDTVEEQEESKEEEELNVIELKFYDKDYKIVKEKLNSISMSPEIAVLKLLGVE
jgi:ParB-like chromosome segregation protein Spo0J